MLSKVSVTGTDTLGLTKPLRQDRQTTLKMPKKGIKRESQKERKKRFSTVEDIKADIKKQQNRPDTENVQNAQNEQNASGESIEIDCLTADTIASIESCIEPQNVKEEICTMETS